MRTTISTIIILSGLAVSGCDQKTGSVVAVVKAVKSLTSGGFSCSQWSPSIDAMANLSLSDVQGLPANTRGTAYFPNFFSASNPVFADPSWGLILTTDAAPGQPGAMLFRAFAVRLNPNDGQIVELKELINFARPTATRAVDVEALTAFYDASGKETLIIPNVGNNQPNQDDTLRSLLVVDLSPLKNYTDVGASQIILTSNELGVTFGAASYTDQDGHAWAMAGTLPILDFTTVMNDGKYIYMVSRAVPGDGNDLKNLYFAPTLMFRAPMDQVIAGGDKIVFDLAGRLYPEVAAMLNLVRMVTTSDKASSLQTLNAYTDFIGFLPDSDSRKASLTAFIDLMRGYVGTAANPSLTGFLKANQGSLGQVAGALRDGNDSGLSTAIAAGGSGAAAITSLADLYADIGTKYGMTEQDASQAVSPALMPIVTDGAVVPGGFSDKQVDGASTAATARNLDLLTYGGQMFVGVDPQAAVPKLSQWLVENIVQFVGSPSDNTPQMEALFTTNKPPKVVASAAAVDDGFDLAGPLGQPLQTVFFSPRTSATPSKHSCTAATGCDPSKVGVSALDDITSADDFALVRSFTCTK